ncbi:kelch-like protein 10 [Clarias gariepinus]|uniref:kelch-like protein 10 n=1 Tax=Clarias gariepinus TaxID=13013 RepID=UPI00234E1BEB|nr:kelch-like protein 10 [Clarias gariepinus]
MERKQDRRPCNIFNKLRLEKELCDVLLKVADAEFDAHKIILCGCSPYFRALFTHGLYPPDKFEYTIPGVSSEVTELIMEYVYLKRVKITEKNVCELLIAADYLAMDSLVNKCSVFLKAQLCQKNCIGIWRLARFCFCMKLQQQTLQFILYNFEKVLSVSEEFLDLTVEELCEITEKNELNVKHEKVVFEAIMLWIKHAPLEREKHIGLLLANVRLGLLTHDYFIDKVKNNNLVAGDIKSRWIVYSVLLNIHGLNQDEFLSSDLARPRMPSAVLVAIGGWCREVPTNAVEVYDPRAKHWVNVTLCSEDPRAYHGTVFLNGFLYCIGGYDGVNYFNSVRRFDPITRVWTEVGPMHSCRCYVSACVLDDRIYAMGGFSGMQRFDTAERYNPKNNQWSMIAPMHECRSDASATVLNGKVFICGGLDGYECLFTAEYYNPQTNQWTLLPHMTSRRSGLGVVAYGGQVYAIGGYDGMSRLRSAEAYNPQTHSWRNVPDMINQRSNFGIEVLDDLLFVVGGYNGFTTTNNVECYDEETDEWYRVKDMGVFRSALGCCVLSGLPNMVDYTAPQDLLYEDL